tara:strand:- start:10115 stop:11077 length:963 start_codon:yes stop_codon:yes gene_type:complete
MINKKHIGNISISIFSIFLGIFFSEIVAKRFGLGNPVLYKSDNLVGYRLKPNQSILRRKNALVSTDAEGFRINPKAELDVNSNFLVFVGDSVTYGGSYIDNTNLFSSKYCDLIDKNFYCLNNGLNAWGVLNMGRFIANFDIYSKKNPSSLILVILPGDEGRNLKSFSDTPFWDFPPKEPKALNEIIRFINKKYFLPSLKNYSKNQTDNSLNSNKKIISTIQRKTVWNELEELLKKSRYPIYIAITPPKKWFEDKSNRKEVRIYNDFLKKISEVETVRKTCNLYDYISASYQENLYVDGVHLSNKGHELWAYKLKECFDNQ